MLKPAHFDVEQKAEGAQAMSAKTLVERLRECREINPWWPELMREAADTIERLSLQIACDDWTKIAMHCQRCGVKFFRKVKGQRYCDEHRHLAGAVIRAKRDDQ